MRILVTGATGYIGSRLCRHLASQKEHEIISLQRPGHPTADEMKSIEWDLSNPIDETALPESVDAVVHLALARNFRLFPEGVADLFSVNVRATVELLEYARKASASHFLMASTGNSVAPDYKQIIGENPIPPNDFYTASKLAAEALCRPYRSCFPINILRAFFPYGPGQDEKTIQRMIANIKAGKPISLARSTDGNGDQLSLIYVDDFVGLIAQSIKEKWNGLFDVAAQEILSVRQIAEEIGRQLDIEPVFEEGSFQAKEVCANLEGLNKKTTGTLRSFSAGLSALLAGS